MSTKIYNGYKLNLKWDEVPEWVQRHQATFNACAESILTTQLLSSAVRLLDKKWVGLVRHHRDGAELVADEERSDQNASALSTAWIAQMDRSPQDRERDDMETSLVAIPHQGEVYALFYGGHRDMTKLFDAIPEVTEYNYWNNSDPDEDVSEEDWKTRGAIWDKLLGHRAPCLCGPTFTFVEKKVMAPTLERGAAIRETLPSIDQRIHRIAHDDYFRIQAASNPMTESEGISGYMKRARAMETDPEYPAIKDRARADLVDLTPEGAHEWLFMLGEEMDARARALAHQDKLAAVVPADSGAAKPRM